MYRTGHYGVALLVYAPVGAALLLADRPGLAVAAGAVVLALTPVPDWDLRVPFLTHRGATHTVGFALLVGAAVGAAGGYAAGGGDGPLYAGLGFLAGTLAVGAHLLADVLTPAGVRPFWPLSGRSYSLGVARASNPLANYLLLAVGVFVAALAALGARGL